jgi:uncharacterized membrane protein YeaQ/YmgE (transglycosylase-associated protein family)
VDATALLIWLVIGAVAGFLAGMVMKGGGYGIVGDIVVGILGALVGGFLANALGLGGPDNLVTSILVAFVGACILIAIIRALPGRSPV